jgi:hypothetical protein
MATIQRNNTGLSGEYFVAAELYRRGWTVGITMGNAKAIDILAVQEDKRVEIQVKSIFQRKNVGWPIMKDKVKLNCIYIFVNLNADKMSHPDYYIGTGDEIFPKVKQYEPRGIVNLSSLNSPEFIERWDKLTL